MSHILKKSSIIILVLAMIIIQIAPAFAAEDSENINGGGSTPEQSENVEISELPENTEEEASNEEAADSESTEVTSEEAEAVTEAPKLLTRKLLAQSSSECYMDAFVIKSQKDGTAPWDSDDNTGNDSSASNGIVRTFDDILYNFEYTTALSGNNTVDEADLNCEFTLTVSPAEAEFNSETLNWMVDKEITYYYSDGTSSATWNENKTVTKQVLTGKRHISNSGDTNAIPGVGTIVTGVKIKAAKNGDIVKPTFSAWISGEDKKTIQGNEISVTAEPRYNLQITRNTSKGCYGYWNVDNFDYSTTKQDNSVLGRMLAYNIIISLYNTSIDKGLKGIEFPSGDFTYDIYTTEKVGGVDYSNDDRFTTYLYDYIEPEQTSNRTKNIIGHLGRNMTVDGCIGYETVNALWNKGGPGLQNAYNGGTVTVTPDDIDNNLWHVTVKDYEFKYSNLIWPAHYRNQNSGSETIIWTKNIGAFSCATFEFLQTFPSADELYAMGLMDDTLHADLLFTVYDTNLQATSISGQATTTNMRTTDDSNAYNFSMMPSGTWNKGIFIYTDNPVKYLPLTNYSSGDASISIGNYMKYRVMMWYGGDLPLTSTNFLVKFDDECYEIPPGTGQPSNIFPGSIKYDGSTHADNAKSKVNKLNVLFAAKPDKTGWESDDEMKATHDNQLVYFKTIDDLTNAGYTCVGVLYEVRDSEIYSVGTSGWGAFYASQRIHIKDTAVPGQVYAYMIDNKSWTVENDFSYTDYEVDGHYWSGSGEAGYPPQNYGRNTSYVKSAYTDGVITSGHTGGYFEGQSILIIGDITKISVTADKNIYDLDAGQRTATYTIKPILSTESGAGDFTDNVYITATLPKELTYVVGSASLAPEEIITNADGTTTIKWQKDGVKVNSGIDPITIQCTIGKAGTAEDVHNGDSIPITTSIASDLDKRKLNETNGNISSVSVSVIRLAATSVSKEVDKPLMDKNNDFTFTLHYGNNAEEDAMNIQIYDELPYSNDGRGTSYNGSYKVTKVEIDFSAAPKTLQAWDGELGTASRGQNIRSDIIYTALTGGVTSGNKITYTTNISPEALALKFSKLFGQEFLTVNIACHPTGNKADDIYANSFRQNAQNQAAPVTSNVVATQVVNRSITGLVFEDVDANGLREDEDMPLSGWTVKLYSPDSTDYTSSLGLSGAGYTVHNVRDADGNFVQPVTTTADGSYSFTNLKAGRYVVVLTGLGNKYKVTEKNVGTNRTIDSDASLSATNAYIEEIILPEVSDMTSTHYITEHNDFGLYIPTRKVVIKKNVTGNLGDLTKEFEFTLTLDASQRVPWVKGSESGVYTGKAYSFKLKDDESITVELPLGTKYTLSEGANDHVASYTITSNAASPVIAGRSGGNIISNQKMTTKEETVDGADETITISVVNERNLAVISGTAYRTDFIIAMLLMLICISTFLYKRKFGR